MGPICTPDSNVRIGFFKVYSLGMESFVSIGAVIPTYSQGEIDE